MVRKTAGWVPAHGPRQPRGFPRSCLGLHTVSSGSRARWVGLPCALGREAISQQGEMPVLCRTVLACPWQGRLRPPASPLPAPHVGGPRGWAGLRDLRLSPRR